MGVTGKIHANPLHPYTKMLMGSVPRLDLKWEDLDVQLRAKDAQSTHGCVYFDRCPMAEEELGCEMFSPPLTEVEPDHFVACFRCAQD